MAIRQELAGPKSRLNSCNGSIPRDERNQVKIPELEILGS